MKSQEDLEREIGKLIMDVFVRGQGYVEIAFILNPPRGSSKYFTEQVQVSGGWHTKDGHIPVYGYSREVIKEADKSVKTSPLVKEALEDLLSK